MPQIPIVQSRVSPGYLELPRPTAQGAMEGFRSIGEFGQTLQKADDQMRSVEEAGNAERILSGTAIKLDDELKRLSKEADYQTFSSSYAQSRQQIMQDAQAQVQNFSPRMKKMVTPHLEKIGAHYEILGNHQDRELRANHEIADTDQALPNLARLAAQAQLDDGQKEYFRGLGVGRIKAISGYVGEVKATGMLQNFDKLIASERQKYFSTDLADQLDNLSNQALRQPAAVDEIYQQGLSRIDQAAGDWLPLEKKKEVVNQFRNQIYYGALKSKIDADPQGTLNDLKAGKYDQQLNQQTLLSITHEAQGEIDRLASQAEAQRKEYERQVGKMVTDYKESKMLGFDWRGPVSEAKLADLVKGSEHEVDFANARSAGGVLAKFNQLPPVAQETYLRQQLTGAKTGDEAKFYKTLEAAHQKTVEMLNKDPISFAVRQRAVAPLPPLDLANPASLQSRSKAASIAEQRYGRPVSPLSDDEASAIATQMEKLPADGKTMILQRLRAGLEDKDIKNVASQFAKKDAPTIALATGMSLEAPAVASEILRGLDVMKDTPKIVPSGQEAASMRDKINSYLGDAYQHQPELMAAISNAAHAIYADRSWRDKDLSGIFNDSRLEQSVKDATGGLLQLRGGLFSWYKVQPPKPGMNENQFRDALKAADYSGIKFTTPEEVQKRGTFESVGDGRYLVKIGPSYVQGAKGPFVLDLNKVGRVNR